MAVAGLSLFTSCKDDNDSNPTLIQPTSFVVNNPAIGSANLDLEKSTTVNLTWSQPAFTDFGAPVIPTYTVQLSPSGSFTKQFDASLEDNTGADFVSLAETYSSGSADINTSTINRALNELMGWSEADVPAVLPLSVRVKAAVQDASFNEYGVIYSNIIALNTVPSYVELKPAEPIIWYMVGNCIGSASWSNDANGVGVGLVPMFLVANESYDIKTGAGLTTFTGFFPAGGQFKFVKVPGSWDEQLNYTNVKAGSVATDEDGDNHNLGIPEDGYYTIQIDSKDNSITVVKYEGDVKVYDNLCIAGSFNEWSDSDMTPVFTLDGAENHIWSYEVNGGDKLKVKVPGSWDTNWGYKTGLAGSGDGDGNLVVPDGKYLLLFNDITGDYMLIDQN